MSSKPTTWREETPEMQLKAALDGDKDAQSLVIRGPLANVRVIMPAGKGFNKNISLSAARAYLTHGGQQLPPGRGKTPVEVWARRTHCPADGSILLDGVNVDLGLDYSAVSRDLLADIRVLVAAGRMGATVDDQADRIEEILAIGKMPTGSRFWDRCAALLTGATAVQRAEAETWIDTGGYSVQRQSVVCVSNTTRTGTRDPYNAAISQWENKLAFFMEQEALVADPSQKFSIQKSIEECRAKLYELKEH